MFRFYCDADLTRTVFENIKKLHYVKNDNNTISDVKFLNQKEDFKDIHNWFSYCVDNVIRELDLPFNKLVITESWSNKAEKQQWHHTHKHPNSYLSGIFYLTTSDSGGFTWFSDRNIWYKHHLVEDNLNDNVFNENKHLVITKEKPEAGKLILFPSFVQHSVDNHNDDEPRYTIAFNTYPNMLITKPSEYLHILSIPRSECY